MSCQLSRVEAIIGEAAGIAGDSRAHGAVIGVVTIAASFRHEKGNSVIWRERNRRAEMAAGGIDMTDKGGAWRRNRGSDIGIVILSENIKSPNRLAALLRENIEICIV